MDKILYRNKKASFIWDDYLQLYLPLYHGDLKGDTLMSFDQNHASCTVTGATWGSDGRVFDGASYIERAVANWRSSDTAGSILIWFKTSSATHQVLFASADEGSALRFLYFRILSTGYLSVAQRNNDSVDQVDATTSDLSDGAWHLGALISSGTAYSLYADTTLQSLSVAAGANNGDWFADTGERDNFSVGVCHRDTLINYLTGTIGEVWVYSRALSAAEITHNYNVTKWRYRV